MREFGKHPPKGDIVWLAAKCVGAVALLIVTIFLVRASWRMYVKMSEASRSRGEAAVQLARVEAQRSGVDTTLNEIVSQRGVEKQIRERYGVARPGEGEIQILRDQKASTTKDTPQSGWWQRLSRMFILW